MSYVKVLWKNSLLTVLCCTVALFMLGPSKADAASDSAWDAALQSIGVLHDSYKALDEANKLKKQQIQVLRKQNDDRLKSVNAKVQGIDKAKIDKLKSEADQAQKKYQPLLNEYTDLGKKAADARKRKDQKAALQYDLKRNQIKASASAARAEIKSRKDALAAAKKEASAKAKAVKDTLAQVQTLKKQVTAENKKITAANSTRSASDKRYKAAIKLGNAITATAELTVMYKELGKISASLNQIYQWEKQIDSVIRTAETKLPKS
ncbi:hypothetical protein ACTHSJ_09795 [Paenibacillus cellulositrophicus]|uniref:hypothetical protein n=1 Tax=Paenibacillus cellulositrophicus TaxID=562959 RepID=UPI003F7E4EE0